MCYIQEQSTRVRGKESGRGIARPGQGPESPPPKEDRLAGCQSIFLIGSQGLTLGCSRHGDFKDEPRCLIQRVMRQAGLERRVYTVEEVREALNRDAVGFQEGHGDHPETL